jgi:hypothetical protein
MFFNHIIQVRLHRLHRQELVSLRAELGQTMAATAQVSAQLDQIIAATRDLETILTPAIAVDAHNENHGDGVV